MNRTIFGKLTRSILAVAGVAASSLAWAIPIDVTGQGQILATPPASVAGGSPDPAVTWQQGFAERSQVLLPADVAVDGGTVAAGTRVDSTMIMFQHAGEGKAYAEARWTFDGLILGLMTDKDGVLMAASDGLLGAVGTYYPGLTANRGMEGGDWWNITGEGYSLDVGMWVAEPGDWIRVLTASAEPAATVPEPGPLALLAFGLLGIAAVRRRSS